MAESMANKGVSAMKTFDSQFLAMIQSDTAGGHRHGQKNDICVMISDLAGRDADPGTFTDMTFAAGGASDSA